MANVLVRDLPEHVHAGLRLRAESAGQSLQQFLATELTRLATTPTLGDVIARISRRTGGHVGLDVAVSDLDQERSRS